MRRHTSSEMLLSAMNCSALRSLSTGEESEFLSKSQVARASYVGGSCLAAIITFSEFGPLSSWGPEGDWGLGIGGAIGVALTFALLAGGPIGFFLGVIAYYGIFAGKVSRATVRSVTTRTLLVGAIATILLEIVLPVGVALSIPLTIVAFFIICAWRSRLERKAGMS